MKKILHLNQNKFNNNYEITIKHKFKLKIEIQLITIWQINKINKYKTQLNKRMILKISQINNCLLYNQTKI